MFDILVYLFENYFEADLHPDQPTLAQELSAAGFDSSDIHQAFDWLNGLDDLVAQPRSEALAASAGMRIFVEEECKVISLEIQGLLAFLASSGILDPVQREWVIDRIFAIGDREVTLDQVKWIVLIVLWSQGKADEYLFIEDLLFSDHPPQMH